jgi:hypothetical protein
MRPQQGQFDLRSIDDGMPVERVRSGAGKAVIITSFVVGIAAFFLGAGIGISSVGRSNMNTANRAAKSVKAELESMQKTLTQIGASFASSQARLAGARKEATAFDPKLSEDLSKVKLDPRPDTSKIFRVDYFRLEDVVIDRLFTYYYDSIALYAEVERHIKRTKNDESSLESFTEKEGAKQKQNYGVVFDTSGKLMVANMVEVGAPACKGDDEGGGGGGGKKGKKGDKAAAPADSGEDPNCTVEAMIGFKIRSNTGAPWVVRKVSNKGTDGVVPLKPTPLMDAVMSGSPDQVRYESYKQRVANMRAILARITATQKELMEGVNKAASRPDVFTLF